MNSKLFLLAFLCLSLGQIVNAQVCAGQCPPLNYPNPSCLDKTVSIVTCVQQANGQCGYSVTCPNSPAGTPPPCSAIECGTQPPGLNLPTCLSGAKAPAVCNRLGDATCAWQAGNCPGEPIPTLSPCTLDDCGPLNFVNPLCSDGSKAAVTCGRLADRTCGYQASPCPGATTAPPTPGVPTPATGQPCSTDAVCGNGLYCQRANCDNSQLGLCTPYNLNCLNIYSPVCGCNGQTYNSNCFATAARVNVNYLGVCTNATSAPNATSPFPTTRSPLPTYPTPGPIVPTPSSPHVPTKPTPPTPAPTPFHPPTPARPTPPVVFPTPAKYPTGRVPTPQYVPPAAYPSPALTFTTAAQPAFPDNIPLDNPSPSPTYETVAPPTPPPVRHHNNDHDDDDDYNFPSPAPAQAPSENFQGANTVINLNLNDLLRGK